MTKHFLVPFCEPDWVPYFYSCAKSGTAEGEYRFHVQVYTVVQCWYELW